MNKNAIIGILIIALDASLYFVSQNEESVSSVAGSIGPSKELRAAYEESSQHSAMADVAELSCLPTSRYDCSLGGGCAPSAPGSYYFVDYGTESGTYFRCDARGCDPYPVKVVHSGIYTQFVPTMGQAMLFKVTNDDALATKGEFVDIATIGTASIVSFGKCEAVK